jgi:hypothetical protein
MIALGAATLTGTTMPPNTPMSFIGAARALSPDGSRSVCDRLSVKAAEVWAVLAVETSGCGYLPQRCPQILFERHKFHSLTNGFFDAAHPDLSNAVPGGYKGGFAEYQRLNGAIALQHGRIAPAAIEEAALKATSWGLGQIMGANFAMVGYSNARAMVADMLASEDKQLQAFARFLQASRLDGALRSHDWARLARGYDGPEFAQNSYDQRLAGNYARFSIGPLPDLTVRAAQLYLTYLGYKPGAIDGIAARLTVAALHQFQADHRLPGSDRIDDGAVQRLVAALETPRDG